MTTPTLRWRGRLTGLLACVAIGATAASAAAAGTAAAAAGSDHLAGDQRLVAGERLVSPNGQYVLVMQGDGNLVEYAPGNRPAWATGTAVRDSIVRLQGDGNLVVVAPGNRPVWSTGTEGNPEATLRVQDDGNIVLYAKGNRAIWSSRTQPGASASGQRIADLARGEAANAHRNVERGGANCNYYSGALGVGSSCAGSWRAQAWCADFARWVWAQAGVRVAGLTSGAASFASYGRANRTWRAGADARNARVGDALVYRLGGSYADDHVGLVVAVNGNGTLDVVSGNSSNRVRLERGINPVSAGVSGYTSPAR